RPGGAGQQVTVIGVGNADAVRGGKGGQVARGRVVTVGELPGGQGQAGQAAGAVVTQANSLAIRQGRLGEASAIAVGERRLARPPPHVRSGVGRYLVRSRVGEGVRWLVWRGKPRQVAGGVVGRDQHLAVGPRHLGHVADRVVGQEDDVAERVGDAAQGVVAVV